DEAGILFDEFGSAAASSEAHHRKAKGGRLNAHERIGILARGEEKRIEQGKVAMGIRSGREESHHAAQAQAIDIVAEALVVERLGMTSHPDEVHQSLGVTQTEAVRCEHEELRGLPPVR